MTAFEFRNKFNVRDIERCCFTCAYAHLEADGVIRCCHPDLYSGEDLYTDDTTVCDGWSDGRSE